MEKDPLKPSTFLTPSQLSELDQWEALVSETVEDAIEMFREIEQENGPQSIATWATLIESWIEHDRLAVIAAALIRNAAREPFNTAEEN